MKVLRIGSGNMDGGIGATFTTGRHPLTIYGTNPERAKQITQKPTTKTSPLKGNHWET